MWCSVKRRRSRFVALLRGIAGLALEVLLYLIAAAIGFWLLRFLPRPPGGGGPVFLFASVAVALLISVMLIWHLHRRVRAVPVHCAQCGFTLTGRRIGRCPNCGASARLAYEQSVRRCLRCGYNLTGNQSRTCPECGTVVGSLLVRKTTEDTDSPGERDSS